MTTTALTTLNYPALPLPARDPEVNRLVDWCMSGSRKEPGSTLVLTNWPSDRQRAQLRDRFKALVAHIGKHDRVKAGAAVGAMLGCYPAERRQDEASAKKAIAKYVQELRDLPTWAIERACAAIRNAEYPEHITYPPSTIALKGLAEGYVRTVRDEQTRIFNILHAERAAEPVSAEERARVSVGLQSLATHLRGLPDPLAEVGRARAAELAEGRKAILSCARTSKRTTAEAAE